MSSTELGQKRPMRLFRRWFYLQFTGKSFKCSELENNIYIISTNVPQVTFGPFWLSDMMNSLYWLDFPQVACCFSCCLPIKCQLCEDHFDSASGNKAQPSIIRLWKYTQSCRTEESTQTNQQPLWQGVCLGASLLIVIILDCHSPVAHFVLCTFVLCKSPNHPSFLYILPGKYKHQVIKIWTNISGNTVYKTKIYCMFSKYTESCYRLSSYRISAPKNIIIIKLLYYLPTQSFNEWELFWSSY